MRVRAQAYLGGNGSPALWFSLFGPPVVWFGAQSLAYFVVPYACRAQETWVLHLTAAAALAITVLAGYAGWRIWREAGRLPSRDAATASDRSRFLAELAMGGSALFGLVLIGQWVAVAIIGPCIPLPRVPFTPDAMLGSKPLLFAHVGQTLAPHDLWTAWSLNPGIALPLIWGGVFYGAGLRSSPRRSARRAMAFAAGWTILGLALLSPLHALAEVLFSAHMAQHTLLIAVAAPLIVLSRPVLTSLWALPRPRRRTLMQHAISRSIARVMHRPPAPAFMLHAATIWIWHLPFLYQASIASGWIHAVQHASFLLTALVFWTALLNPARRAAYGAAVLYLFATAVHTGILGALMTLAPVGWYPSYAASTDVWGLTLLEDQQLAGIIMWMPGGVLYVAAGLLILVAWLREAEVRTVRFSPPRAPEAS